ncbi:hypothetical protein MUP65_01265 [Patescibacteria group bacterium]|nr:hypothetical protein [Patescibacteria group bacterium]
MIVAHGDNNTASRNYLTDQTDSAKKKGWQVITLDGKTASLTRVTQAIEGNLFFADQTLVIIESIYSAPKSGRQKNILDYLKKTAVPVIIWEPKQIDGRRLQGVPKPSQKLFSIPVILYKFLDSLKPASHQYALPLLHQTLQVEPAQKVFYYLVQRIRTLIIFAQLGSKGAKTRFDWQKKRLNQQADFFTLTTLFKIYDNLYKIDLAQKTGLATLDLPAQLDLLLTTF